MYGKSWFSYRYYTAFLIFASCTIVSAQRMSVSINVVSMSNYASPLRQNTSSGSCPIINASTIESSTVKVGGDFDWDSKLQGFIIGAAFISNIFTMSFAGWLTNVIGAKRAIFWGNLLSSVTMLVSPIASFCDVYLLIAVHFVRGLAQGFTLSPCYLVMANWTPRKERSIMSGFMFSGYSFGFLVGALISGYLCDHPLLGWRGSFYFFGGAGVLFCIVFAFTFYETPKDHPRISESELKYIIDDQVSNKNQKRPSTPWLKILTSVPVYALIYGVVGRFWATYHFLTVHPLYMSTILHYPIDKNGLISSMAFLLLIAGSMFSSAFCDWLFRKKYFRVDKLRRGFTFFATFGYSVSVLGIYLAGCNSVANTVLHVIALFTSGFYTPGALITAVDMSPNFAAILMGIAGAFGNLTGFMIPVMVGFMTKNQTMEDWHNVFIVNIVVVCGSGIVFAIFGRAEVQPWNFQPDKSEISTASDEGKSKTVSNVAEKCRMAAKDAKDKNDAETNA